MKLMIMDKIGLSSLMPIPNVHSSLDQLIILILLVYLINQIRWKLKEYSNKTKAKSLNSRIAPLVTCTLPFDLKFLYYKVNALLKGDPSSSLDYLNPYSKLTKAIRINIFGTEIIQTFSHLDVKYILSNNFQNWGKSNSFIEAFYPLLGDGILNSDQRSLWSWHRRLSRPHFTKRRNSDVDACEEHVSRLISWIEFQNMSNHSVDIQDLFSRLTLTIATQHFFGYCLDMLNDLLLDRPIQQGAIDATAFSNDFADTQTRCLSCIFVPFRLFRKLSPDPSTKRVLAAVDVLIENVAKERSLSDDQQEPETLLDSIRRSGCSAHLIRHELLNLLIAGRDSLASLLSSCIYELAGQDELWNQLQLESSHLAQMSEISIDQIHQCELLRAVINETLRLHPPVWSNVRRVFEDDVLPSGIFVPAGTDCRFSIKEFQRDPEVWGMDAEEFVPDRWLDGRKASQSKDPSSFQPFSGGPRLCLGQQFAYTEVSITLIRLINQFSKVELAGKSAVRENIKEVHSVTLSFQDGLWVKFHPLKI
ncbi:cytochrome p450 monooxygenase [Melampsora larici-populina 98AG31]|uniref:Cytochrome p450 monooxygenase n=1 Tax=Melampsora larici-populina (strain 98AG31 / pathotype 3-4-7) TaxID=747676 RepID=F4RY08_MELLP|nr:cytochrome p450 monooxygenase [Melampsora larici-populina 98AG31]EGG02601.1 cytochrome p450 monooxygenase [Melampsora larici-populina 98AG31]